MQSLVANAERFIAAFTRLSRSAPRAKAAAQSVEGDGMRHAEDVTFGGSGLDRAAELRERPEDLERAMADPGARAVLLWRGKPLVTQALSGAAAARSSGAGGRGAGADAARARGRRGRGRGGSVRMGARRRRAGDAGRLFRYERAGASGGRGRRFRRSAAGDDAARPARCGACRDGAGALRLARLHGFCARCGAASEVALAGWQRVCPSCGARHFPRTDPVVIMLDHARQLGAGRTRAGLARGDVFAALRASSSPARRSRRRCAARSARRPACEVGRVGYLA